MEIFPILLLVTLFLIGLIMLSEIVAPGLITEGFENIPRTSYWSSFAAPRSDIGPDQEDRSYVRDPRYFNDYSDVSRFGVKYDFCRMILPSDDPEEMFFTCALAGTDGLDSAKFRTPTVKDGFRVSLDDYMRDTTGDGRDDYCRILKWKDNTYQPVCQRATDLGFEEKETIDPEPPAEIKTILTFYDGCVLWLRFFGDMNDYVKNVKVQTAEGIRINEQPKREVTEGLEFLGNQFLRLSDTSDLSLGTNVPLRSVKAWMVWVKFSEFTNNAKIFDFGNGAGNDNVFLGIYRKGDSGLESENVRPLLCGKEDETIPTEPSGAQKVEEVSPKTAMETTSANVNDYECSGFEVMPRRLSPSFVGNLKQNQKATGRATLVYEVWDKQSRKMSIKVPSAVPLQEWVHICVTATSNDAFRPDMAVWMNGQKVMEKEGGWLPATSSMSNCYLGKSNWMNTQSQYENADEMFHGSMFDFRAYRKALSPSIITESYAWGKRKLDLQD
jgi:hypothetical protein